MKRFSMYTMHFPLRSVAFPANDYSEILSVYQEGI